MDFTQYSYDELVATATQFVANAPGWGQAYQSSFGQTIIQLLAQMTNELNYMLERRTQENFMTIAQLQSSIWALASSIGYRPTRKISANGPLSFQLTNQNGVPVAPQGVVTVPKYTQLTYGTNSFVNVADIVVAAGQSGPTVLNQIKEGTLQSTTVNPQDSTTTLFQSNFVLLTNYVGIENTSLLISDANGPWYDVTTSIGSDAPIGAISFAGPTDRVFDIKINTQGMMIVFGNGTTGLKPTIPLTIQWIQSTGTAVNIVATGLSFSLPTQTVTDNIVVIPPNTYYYSLTNSAAITGAIDEETATSIQQNAPDFVRSADRAVTPVDYAFWARKSGIGGIVDAVSYGQQEAGLNPYQMNNVYVTYLSNTGSPIGQTNEQLLKNYLANLMTMTTYPVVQSATVIPVMVNFRIKKNPNITMANSQFYQLMLNGINMFFPLQKGSLGESVFLSSMISFFEDYQATNNNQLVNAAQWVTISLYALYGVTSPITTNNISVTITTGTASDHYTLVINGVPYTYTQVGTPSAATIATALAALLPTAVVNISVVSNVITLTNAVPQTSFTINNTGSTTPANVGITQTIQLPPYLLPNQNPTPSINLFLPGSVQIVKQSDGTVLYTDNGVGNIAGGTINYVTGAVSIPVLPTGNYYFKYQQDIDENLYSNNQCTFIYSQPVSTYGGAGFAFSTITIL